MPLVDQDEEHLKILAIAYYVQAGMGALMGLFAVLYIVLGLVLVVNPIPASKAGDLPSTMPGALFAILGGIFFLLAGAFAVSQFLAAKFLRLRQRYLFCMINAGVECLWVPFETYLGCSRSWSSNALR
jgi:hypothetical protein